jgi:type I restriction enzyme S subunit
MPKINGAVIRQMEIPHPPFEEMKRVNFRLDSAFAKLDRIAAEARSAAALLDHLDEQLLAKAFRGELVPQDPNDEPASVLLDRIRAERAAQPATRARRSRKAQAAAD